MAKTLKAVDAVMVGMGWSGSIMARELTKTTIASRSCAAHPAKPAICAARRSRAATSSRVRAATTIPTSRW
jgi:hypothetical protein